MTLVGGLGKRYLYSRQGQIFIATHQTPGTAILSPSTSFDATKPTLLLQQSGGAQRLTLSRLRMTQVSPVAGGPIDLVIVIDNIVRRSGATGTAIVPKCPNMKVDPMSKASVFYNPTAVAAGSDARVIESLAVNAVVGEPFELDEEDEIQIGPTGSILIYTFAAVTAPSWRLGQLEWVEEANS